MNWKKFQEKPNNRIILVFTIIGLAIFIIINFMIFQPLSSINTSYGILDLEFAWTKGRVISIFTIWGEEGIVAQKLGVYWDFPYILGYVLFISGCIILVARQLKGRVQLIGFQISLTTPVSGILDIIENINLLIMLEYPTTFSVINPIIASSCALIKFSIIFVCIIYFIIAILMLLIMKIHEK